MRLYYAVSSSDSSHVVAFTTRKAINESKRWQRLASTDRRAKALLKRYNSDKGIELYVSDHSFYIASPTSMYLTELKA